MELLREHNNEISIDLLRRAQSGFVAQRDSDFPTDSEIYDDTYFYSTRKGLYQSRLYELERGFEKVWDCPLLSVSGERQKGLTMAGGDEGVFIFPYSEKVKERYHFMDAGAFQVSKNHANMSEFCSRGIFATSLERKSFYLSLPFNGEIIQSINAEDIFPNKQFTLSWSYRDRVYAYINENIYVKRIVKRTDGIHFIDEDEYWFYPQKGRVLSGTSTYFADIIELEHAFVIFPRRRDENTHAETIWEPVTRWRAFPKSYGYNNLIAVILEDELRIYEFPRERRVGAKRLIEG